MDLDKADEDVWLVPPDPEWPRLFETEQQRMRRALGPWVLAIEHVGSTAIPCIPAKPIVDLLIGLAPSADRRVAMQALEAAGYEDVGLYLRRRDVNRSYNMTLTTYGSPQWRDELLFRDYLRAHRREAEAYAAAKRRAAAHHGRLVGYAREKGPVIQGLLERARQWRAANTTVSE